MLFLGKTNLPFDKFSYFSNVLLCSFLGLIRLQQLFQAVNIGEITLDIDVKRVTDVHEAYMMLKDLHQKDEKANLQVFLDLATKKAEEIIVRIVSSLCNFKIII